MKNIIPGIFITIILLFHFYSYSQGGIKPLNPEFLEALENSNKKEQQAIPYPVNLGYDHYSFKSSNSFPEYFDLRDHGVLPPVKTQSSGGCWAYSSMSTVESRMLVLGEGLYNLSDNNLKYCHGFFDSRSTNGNAWMATAYFARHSGPLLEEQDPHPGGTSQPGVNCPEGESPAFFVRDSRYPPGDMATIKQLVMDVGSVWSLIYYNSTYFNATDDTYFYGGGHAVNHVLNVVGWDDNKVTAGGVGAWICQNTYGTGWGEEGFVYVSYNDSQFLIYNAYFPTFVEFNDDSRVTLYDELGNYSSYGFESEEAFALVKYPVYENLIINQIGTYAMAYGSQIEMEVYANFNELSGELSGLIGAMSAKTTDQPGFYTYDLDESIPVYTGENIFIKVKYATPSYDWPIPIELYIETYSDPFIETGVSWISSDGHDGNWQAIGEGTADVFDLCINVYGHINNCYIHDFDCDCDVDLIDVTMSTYTYGTEFGDAFYDPIFDLDHDEDIDILDITAVTYNYGWECAGKSNNETLGNNNEYSDVSLYVAERNANDGFHYYDVLIEDVENLGGFELFLEFNSIDLDVQEVLDSGFLGSTGRQVIQLENEIDSQNGSIHYSLTTLGSEIEGVSGAGVLFSIKCQKNVTNPATIVLNGGTLVTIDAQIIPFEILVNASNLESPQALKNRLISVSPNPFKEKTIVEYLNVNDSYVEMELYDLFGNHISTLFKGRQKGGNHFLEINRDQMTSGVYFVVLKSDAEVQELVRVIID